MFSEMRTNSDSQEISFFFSIFSLVDRFVNICTKTSMKIALKKLILNKKIFFNFFSPKLCIKTTVFQNTA